MHMTFYFYFYHSSNLPHRCNSALTFIPSSFGDEHFRQGKKRPLSTRSTSQMDVMSVLISPWLLLLCIATKYCMYHADCGLCGWMSFTDCVWESLSPTLANLNESGAPHSLTKGGIGGVVRFVRIKEIHRPAQTRYAIPCREQGVEQHMHDSHKPSGKSSIETCTPLSGWLLV